MAAKKTSTQPESLKGAKKGATYKRRRERTFAEVEHRKKKDQQKQRARLRGRPDGRESGQRAKKVGATCGSKLKNPAKKGLKCTLAAGWGTPHPGTGACKYHGGCVPNHVKKAAVEAAGEEYRELLGTEQEMNPYEAIMWCIKIRAGEIQWLSGQMKELDEKAWIEETLVGKQFHLYARERKAAMQDLVKYSQIAISLGIAERYVRLAEVYGQTIAKLINGILGELNLNEEQRNIAPGAIRRHLLLLEATTDVKEQIPAAVIEQEAA